MKNLKQILMIIVIIFHFNCSETRQPSDIVLISKETSVQKSNSIPIITLKYIHLKKLPSSKDVSEINIQNSFLQTVQNLTPENFLILLDNATPLDPNDKIIMNWHYAPWKNVSFLTSEGRFNMTLYLGGLGFLRVPNGNEGPFKFNFPK